jgi:hypothetical protein
VLGPVSFLAGLAAVGDILTFAAFLQRNSFFELVVGLATPRTLASIGEQIVGSAIILIVSKSDLELFLHGCTEAGIEEWGRIFGCYSNLLVSSLKLLHILRFDSCSNAHSKDS